MKAMILAAGLGTRMKPLTDHTPKPLLPIHGKPLLAYHIEKLVHAGASSIVINHAHLGEQIEAFVKAHTWGVDIALSAESEPLETGGGIMQALPLLGHEPFLLINGDVWMDYPLERLLGHSLNGLAHLVCVPNPSHHPQGDFAVVDGQVMLASSVQPTVTYSGLSVLHPAIFTRKKPGKFPLAPILKEAIGAQQVTGEVYRGYWLDVGTPARLEELSSHLAP